MSTGAPAYRVLPGSLARGMPAFYMAALGALQTGNDYTGLYVAEGLCGDVGNRVGLGLDGGFFHRGGALGA